MRRMVAGLGFMLVFATLGCEAGPRRNGAFCDADDKCTGGICLQGATIADGSPVLFEDGVCTQDCSVSACGRHERCARLPGGLAQEGRVRVQDFCLLGCFGDGTCRPGYQCIGVGQFANGSGVCWPEFEFNTPDVSPFDVELEDSSGPNQPPERGDGNVPNPGGFASGSECFGDDACAFGVCFPEVGDPTHNSYKSANGDIGFPSGMCSAACAFFPCEEPRMHCSRVPNVGIDAFCLPACLSEADCRPQYNCHSIGEFPRAEGVCWPSEAIGSPSPFKPITEN